MREILSRSKISCLTSLREDFGVVLIEAMFSSNALIAYDCPSGPSEIVNRQNGFLIPLGNKIEFKEKLKYLMQNPKNLDDLMSSSYSESKKWKKNLIIDKWDLLLNETEVKVKI